MRLANDCIDWHAKRIEDEYAWETSVEYCIHSKRDHEVPSHLPLAQKKKICGVKVTKHSVVENNAILARVMNVHCPVHILFLRKSFHLGRFPIPAPLSAFGALMFLEAIGGVVAKRRRPLLLWTL